MRIKIKILYDDKYKNDDAFDAAVERWQEKGWRLADIAQDFKSYGDDAAAILWMPVMVGQDEDCHRQRTAA